MAKPLTLSSIQLHRVSVVASSMGDIRDTSPGSMKIAVEKLQGRISLYGFAEARRGTCGVCGECLLTTDAAY